MGAQLEGKEWHLGIIGLAHKGFIVLHDANRAKAEQTLDTDSVSFL